MIISDHKLLICREDIRTQPVNLRYGDRVSVEGITEDFEMIDDLLRNEDFEMIDDLLY